MTIRPQEPLSHQRARQFLQQNAARTDGTVLAVNGADANGRGMFRAISYKIAYLDGMTLREIDNVQPSEPWWPDECLILPARVGAPVRFIRRGQSIEYAIWSAPYMKICETTPEP